VQLLAEIQNSIRFFVLRARGLEYDLIASCPVGLEDVRETFYFGSAFYVIIMEISFFGDLFA
jgi:hypothetical protein